MVDSPEIEFDIESETLINQTRQLKAIWTAEAAADLRAFHNLNAEKALTDALVAEINDEID